MHKTLIAAALIAGLVGLGATSAAHADAYNGEAQHSENVPEGRAIPPAFSAMVADAYAYEPPTQTGVDTTPFFSKSHGRP